MVLIGGDGLTPAVKKEIDAALNAHGLIKVRVFNDDRTARELARGNLQRVLVQGERGYVIMSSAGPEAVLTVLAKPNAKLGLIFLDIKRAAETLSKLI